MKIMEARIIIKGMVQMVGFRFYAVRQAEALGIKGFVRNLASGEVEVVAQADEKSMKEFIKLLKKGPSGAIVRGVEIDDNPGIDETFTGFSVRY